MRSPYSFRQIVVFVVVLVVLQVLVQFGVLSIAFERLELSQSSATLLLLVSLAGSAINLPLFTVDADMPPGAPVTPAFRGLWHRHAQTFTGKTTVAVNVGGAVVPVAFTLFLLSRHPLPLGQVVLAVLLVALTSYLVSRPIAGLGIGMPIFVAPFTAALVAVVINPQQSAPLAYICGTLGVLIGADLLRLKDIRKMGTPLASIGGAGTFDGIYMTGIVAVLLA
jgi:uncharacterized membrane protein